MLQEERFNKILEELAENGAVKNVDLSRSLGVSESTVRRDINELDEMGKLRKVFGGAIGLKRPVNTKEDDVVTKASAHVREKDAIARYAAGLIRDDDAVFIDAGTTTERMTEYIANKNAVYMTNGILHAQKLAQRGFKVNIVSGMVKKATLSIVGAGAAKSLSNLNFTKCFMGANGIDLEKGFTTPDMDEALIKEEIVNHSNDVYILADSSKFEQVFAVTFTKLKGKCIITDRLDNDLYRKHVIVKEVNK